MAEAVADLIAPQLRRLELAASDLTLELVIPRIAEVFRQELGTHADHPEPGNADWRAGYDEAMSAAAELISDLERRLLKARTEKGE